MVSAHLRLRAPRQWPAVAAELGTGRAAVDCLARFQRELHPEFLRRPWTHEEEARLTAAVLKHGHQWTARPRACVPCPLHHRKDGTTCAVLLSHCYHHSHETDRVTSQDMRSSHGRL
jgi:hypothetical protein